MRVQAEELSFSFLKVSWILIFFFIEQQRQPHGMCARMNICRAAPGSSPLPPVSAVPAALSQAEKEAVTGELAEQ